jgi:hypothetical protein
MGTHRHHRAKTARIWMRVMREGMSIDLVASEFGMPSRRVERILFAFGKRRVAKEVSKPDTQRVRRVATRRVLRQ